MARQSAGRQRRPGSATCQCSGRCRTANGTSNQQNSEGLRVTLWSHPWDNKHCPTQVPKRWHNFARLPLFHDCLMFDLSHIVFQQKKLALKQTKSHTVRQTSDLSQKTYSHKFGNNVAMSPLLKQCPAQPRAQPQAQPHAAGTWSGPVLHCARSSDRRPNETSALHFRAVSGARRKELRKNAVSCIRKLESSFAEITKR